MLADLPGQFLYSASQRLKLHSITDRFSSTCHNNSPVLQIVTSSYFTCHLTPPTLLIFFFQAMNRLLSSCTALCIAAASIPTPTRAGMIHDTSFYSHSPAYLEEVTSPSYCDVS